MARSRKRVYPAATTLGEPRAAQNLAAAKGDFCVAFAGDVNPLRYLINLIKRGGLTHVATTPQVAEEMSGTTTWEQRLAMFGMHLLLFLKRPFAFLGRIVELIANTTLANGGLWKTLFRIPLSAVFLFRKGPLTVPAEESVDYRSLIGLLDQRTSLLAAKGNSGTATTGKDAIGKDIFPVKDNGERRVLDLMFMAAKFSYENAAMIKKVVTYTWNMTFVGFYNCWNEYQERPNTQVFIFTDKKVRNVNAVDAKAGANAVVVAWRGTSPFDADDWATDIDFSWYDLQHGMGRIHVGFLEALGLGDRTQMDTFSRVSDNAQPEPADPSPNVDSKRGDGAASGLPQGVIDEKILAYDNTTKIVKRLLKENPKAKLYVTGHSLGGALSVLYASMLYYFGEQEVIDRLGAVYTFGQPRVGDQTFAEYMFPKLATGKLYRVVYCNDIVPRVPFDDRLFKFRHWGLCFYFDRSFEEHNFKDAPNLNYFNVGQLLRIHANAVGELLDSFTRSRKYGADYKESTASFLFRVLALFLPGIASHSPVNYVNAVRLGKPIPLVDELTTDTKEIQSSDG